MKKKNITKNYLENVPSLKEEITYETSDEKIVTLAVENKGVMNKIAQWLFKKPKISYIHLDPLGSYALICADGERNIIEIGKLVEKQFGEKANPLYERLAQFFQILDSYKFINWR